MTIEPRTSRRGNSVLRCARCRLHAGLCVCELLPRIETRTRLVLVMHRDERRKTTNTGQLAAACLARSEVLVHGQLDAPLDPLVWPPTTRPLYLFPHEDALPLTSFLDDGPPVTLVVPDGTWRQASKVRKRVAGVADIPCVSLPPGPPSRYRLREEHLDHGLSTLEAIARALGLLEGEAVQHALENVFAMMVERSLWARGTLATDEVTGGVPAAARYRGRG